MAGCSAVCKKASYASRSSQHACDWWEIQCFWWCAWNILHVTYQPAALLWSYLMCRLLWWLGLSLLCPIPSVQFSATPQCYCQYGSHASEMWCDIIVTYDLLALEVHASHVRATLSGEVSDVFTLYLFVKPGHRYVRSVSASLDHIAWLHSVHHMPEPGVFNHTIWP